MPSSRVSPLPSSDELERFLAAILGTVSRRREGHPARVRALARLRHGERRGLTYLFISHHLQMVELIAHHLIVMYLGQVVEMAPASTLSENASHPYSRLLWSAANAHTGRRASASSGWELLEQERPKEGCRFRARCSVYREIGEPSICREKDSEPELREIGPNHRVKCHFPESNCLEA